VELYLHSPDTPSWRGAQLKKAQGPEDSLTATDTQQVQYTVTDCTHRTCCLENGLFNDSALSTEVRVKWERI
jgi:hypothetical protein